MDKENDRLIILPIEKLKAGIYQPRVQFEHESLMELADSIKISGMLQPILIRPLKEDSYEIIAGERRWRAAQLAGLKEVSCIIREYSDKEAARASLMENIHRTDLNALEQAQMYKRMLDEFNYTHEQLGQEIGKPRAFITKALRLLYLDKSVQTLIIEGKITGSHGQILASVPLEKQYSLAQKSINHEWSKRQLEQETAKILKLVEDRVRLKDPNVNVLEKLLGDHIGCPVEINVSGNKGQIKIDFHNLDILEGLFEKMGFKPEF
jgi:ParB family chromosome partitioning protein